MRAVRAFVATMKRCLLLATAFAGFVCTFTSARADDLKAMEGKWTVAEAEAGGKKIESEDLAKLVVTITGATYSLMTDDGPDGGTLTLDETQNPKTMDATDTEGMDVGKVIRAIYEITGDTMRVCYAIEGGARPTEFATRDGVPWLLITYQRQK